MSKICKECGKNLPATTDYFHKKSDGRNGLCPMCKDCKTQKDRNIYRKDPSKIIKKNITKIAREKRCLHAHIRTKKPQPKYCQVCNLKRGVIIEYI